jgi:hypothetical protein
MIAAHAVSAISRAPRNRLTHPDMHGESFASLMRRQQALSPAPPRFSSHCSACRCSAILSRFMAPVFGGFTLTWFLLGIGFFPAVWVIAYVFIKRSIALEKVTEVLEEEKREKERRFTMNNSRKITHHWQPGLQTFGWAAIRLFELSKCSRARNVFAHGPDAPLLAQFRAHRRLAAAPARSVLATN